MFLDVRMLLFTKISVSLVGDCSILIWKYNGLNSILNNNNKKKPKPQTFLTARKLGAQKQKKEKSKIFELESGKTSTWKCACMCAWMHMHMCVWKNTCACTGFLSLSRRLTLKWCLWFGQKEHDWKIQLWKSKIQVTGCY